MRPITKRGWLRPAISCHGTRSLAGPRRLIHSKPSDRSSAEASPVARSAKYEASSQPSVIEEIALRRVKAGKLVAGVAAASNSDMFKGDVSCHELLESL